MAARKAKITSNILTTSSPTSSTATGTSNPASPMVDDHHDPAHKKLSGNFEGVSASPLTGLPDRFFTDEASSEEEAQRIRSKLSKKEFNYQQAAYEIYTTETDYVVDLQIIFEVYFEPMEKQFGKELVKSIFTDNFVHLTRIHDVLLETIKALRNGPYAKNGLGELFFRHATIFQSYSPYFVNYPAAILAIEKKKKDNNFVQLVKAAENNPRCRKLNLESFIIKPIQRVMKYPLLLRELIKYCEDDQERASLEKANSKMQEVVAKLNEDQRVAENREKIHEIIAKFSDKKALSFLIPKPEFPDLDARFYLEAKVQQMGKPDSESSLFLFSDHLLYAKPQKFHISNQLKLLRSWPLSAIIMNDYSNNESMAGIIEITEAANVTQRFWFQLGAKKAKWMSTLEELGVKNHGAISPLLPTPSPVSTIPDEESENLEELFKSEQSRAMALEEQLQQVEEKMQELNRKLKDEEEKNHTLVEANKAREDKMSTAGKDAEAKVKQTAIDLEKANRELAKLRPLCDQQTMNLRRVERVLKEAEQDAKSKEGIRLSLAEQARADKQKIAAQEQRITDLEAQGAKSRGLEAEAARARELESQLQALRAESSQASQKLIEVEKAAALKLQESQGAAQTKGAELQGLLDKAREDLKGAEQRAAMAEQKQKESAASLQKDLDAAEAKITKLSEEARTQQQELEKALQDLSEVKLSESKVARELESARKDLGEKGASSETVIKDLQGEVARLTTEKEAHRNELATARRELEQAEAGRQRALLEAEEIRKKLVEEVSSQKLLVQAAEQEAQRAVLSLRDLEGKVKKEREQALIQEQLKKREEEEKAKEASKEASKEAPKEAPKETPKEAPKETPTEADGKIRELEEKLQRLTAEKTAQFLKSQENVEMLKREVEKAKASSGNNIWMVATIVLIGALVAILGPRFA